jgi:acetylglutamate kinase
MEDQHQILDTITAKKEALFVIKIGGNIIDDAEKLKTFLNHFTAINSKKILVHGGGKLATQLAKDLGIEQQMIEGRRITDAATLKIVTMVYAGFINKNIVVQLQSNGSNAIGFTGADANLIKAHKRLANTAIGIDYGFVGDIDEVNTAAIQPLLAQDIAIVVAPITHDGNGQLLNTNADTIAQSIATAMSSSYEVSLLYCFEKKGVLLDSNDDNSVIPTINQSYFKKLKDEKLIFAGMIPKLENAFAALEKGVSKVIIGRAESVLDLVQAKEGTIIQN